MLFLRGTAPLKGNCNIIIKNSFSWNCGTAPLKGNCNAKIKNSFKLENDSSNCIHDRKIVLDY